MVQKAAHREDGADERLKEAVNEDSHDVQMSTQNTQYDQIGSKYLEIKTLPAAEPELPSILAALGEGGVRGKTCLDLACGTGKYSHLLSELGATSVTGYDISTTMINDALSAYPPAEYPSLHFGVVDCSIPHLLPASSSKNFDLVFSAWFLNYAGSETELTNMFRVIESQMKEGGRFVGLTTDAHDPDMAIPKPDFYGIDIVVLEPAYVAPDTNEVVGIKARVKVGGGEERGGFEFDVFQFRKDIYEKCAGKAGLRIVWKAVVVPHDDRRDTAYWKNWLSRPTFTMLEARRVAT